MAMLSPEEVLKIARLARLELTPEEVQLYRTRLGRVLEYVKDLEKLATEPDAFVKHIPRDAVALREDKSVRFADPELLMKNAPATQDGQFLLPTIVERDE